MTSLQSRIWDWMNQLINDFNQRTLTYHGLVHNLDVLMEAAHVEDDAIRQVWYGGWKELAKFDNLIQSGEGPDLMMAQPAVEKMKTIILECKKLSLNGAGNINSQSFRGSPVERQ